MADKYMYRVGSIAFTVQNICIAVRSLADIRLPRKEKEISQGGLDDGWITMVN